MKNVKIIVNRKNFFRNWCDNFYERGFTLVEAIIVIALFAVLSIVLVTIFLNQNKIYKNETAQLDTSYATITALDDIDNYVRQSYRTLASYSTYTGGPQVLILQIQSIDSAGVIAGTYDYVIYRLSSGNLQRIIIANAASTRVSGTKTVGANITNVTFTYNSASYPAVTEVATNITSSEAGAHQTNSFTTNSKAKLRNYQ